MPTSKASTANSATSASTNIGLKPSRKPESSLPEGAKTIIKPDRIVAVAAFHRHSMRRSTGNSQRCRPMRKKTKQKTTKPKNTKTKNKTDHKKTETTNHQHRKRRSTGNSLRCRPM